jgi:hypothetical protein
MHELTDLCLLVAQVVEVEKQRVRNAAVDAGDPKRSHLLTPLSSAMRVAPADVRDVRHPVPSVPLFRVGTLTFKANPLSRLQRKRTKWEFDKSFAPATDPTRASLHGRREQQLNRCPYLEECGEALCAERCIR